MFSSFFSPAEVRTTLLRFYQTQLEQGWTTRHSQTQGSQKKPQSMGFYIKLFPFIFRRGLPVSQKFLSSLSNDQVPFKRLLKDTNQMCILTASSWGKIKSSTTEVSGRKSAYFATWDQSLLSCSLLDHVHLEPGFSRD